MKILGVDTAIPTASVALIDNGDLIVESLQGESLFKSDFGKSAQAIGNHAEIILPLIQSLFGKTRVKLEDLSGISLSIGPGSFTGLRIGLATAKGLAYDAGLPLVGISTLWAMAARVNDFNGIIGALLDARKGEVYVALFRRHDQSLNRLTEDAVLSIESAIDLFKNFHADRALPLLLIGNGAIAHERKLRTALADWPVISNGTGYASVASWVALLALPRFAAASFDDIGVLAPIYLRMSEAQTRREILP
jgi:tRNA threonylcarbamoyladenosine biosynthesis protein TsaB